MDVVNDKLGSLLLLTRELFPAEVLLVMYVSVGTSIICPSKLPTVKLFVDDKTFQVND